MVVVFFLMYADTNQASPLYNSNLNTELYSNSNPFPYRCRYRTKNYVEWKGL